MENTLVKEYENVLLKCNNTLEKAFNDFGITEGEKKFFYLSTLLKNDTINNFIFNGFKKIDSDLFLYLNETPSLHVSTLFDNLDLLILADNINSIIPKSVYQLKIKNGFKTHSNNLESLIKDCKLLGSETNITLSEYCYKTHTWVTYSDEKTNSLIQ